MISEGFDLIIIVLILRIRTDRRGQYRPRLEHGVCSGYTLFASHPSILHTFSDRNMVDSVFQNFP